MIDMEEFDACTAYQRQGDTAEITCRFGMWSVRGPYGLKLIDEAMGYFQQYKLDGEYASIIGGDSVADRLRESMMEVKNDHKYNW